MGSCFKIVFLIPTELEFRPIVRAFCKAYGGGGFSREASVIDVAGRFLFVRCGIGKRSVKRSIRSFATKLCADLIVSAGCAGAVHPGLLRGTILLPETVVNDHEQKITLALEAFADMPAAVRCSAFLSLQKPADREAKRAFRKRHPDVWALDMESFWIAREAAAIQTPCALLRVTADTAEERIPGWVLCADGFYHRFTNLFFGLLYRIRAKKACRTLGKTLGCWLKRP